MSQFKFFSDCKTLQDVKIRYRELVFLSHPDRGGDLETMKQINLEYEKVFEYVKNHPINETEEKFSKYANINDGYREHIEKVVFIPEIDIEICGSWIWITGNTKPVKDIIKNAGYFWSKNKTAWYWRPEGFKSYNRKKYSMDDIRGKYGSQKVQKEERKKLLVKLF